jgi:hypothetical protein
MMIHKSILAAAVLAVGLTSAALAATNSADPAEVKTLGLASVTAADAVSAVESTSGGKVVELTLRDQNGQPAYQVSVIKSDGTELTFLVDGLSGTVTATDDVQDTTQAGDTTSDKSESGESANDQDSSNEDAN